MRINSNMMAFNAYRNLTVTTNSMAKSLEKLSSGFRINRAADDAAGLVISQGLRAQVSGLRQATRNAQDGISVVQTAEGALNEIGNMLNRMRDLSVQAANTATNDITARNAAQGEITQLTAEITRVTQSTTFGVMKLLDGSFGVTPATTTSAATIGTVGLGFKVTATTNDVLSITVNGLAAVNATIAAGTYTDGNALAAAATTALRNALLGGNLAQAAYANSVNVTATPAAAGSGFTLKVQTQLRNGETFVLGGTAAAATVNGAGVAASGGLGFTAAVTAATGTGGTFQVGAYAADTIAVSIGKVDAAGLGVAALDVVSSASAAMTALDSAISLVSGIRGTLGAVQNRFESTIANLQVSTENLTASESRIRDTDMALEMTNFTRSQIMQQAGTAMLAQANAVPQSILKLLQ